METTPSPVALLWSGGKDAALALAALREEGDAVAALVTTVLEEGETVTMHGVPLALVEAQARALELPLRVMRLPEGAPNAVYEERLAEALAPLRAEGVAVVAAGDLFLEDVRAYRAAALQRLGFEPRFPLWKRDTTRLAHRFIEAGYRATVCSVDTTQLSARFAGRPYDAALLRDLPPSVDPCGERGAFHTFVIGGPPFRTPVAARKKGVRRRGRLSVVEWEGR